MIAEEVESKSRQPASEETRAMARRAFGKAMAKYQRQVQGQKKGRKHIRKRKILSRIINVAACLILILGISMPIAVATSEQVRTAIMNLLVHMQSNYSSVKMMEDAEPLLIPEEWGGKAFPRYIPKGYTISNMLGNSCIVEFEDSEGHSISYLEYPPGSVVEIDTEDAKVSYEEINGNKAMISVKEDATVLWSNDYLIYQIKAPDYETCVAVARGVEITTK